MVGNSSRPYAGLLFALVTAFFWGSLPIALKIVLQQLDPYSLTEFRFLVSFVFLLPLYYFNGYLRQYSKLSAKEWGILIVAALSLAVNYITYLIGVEFTTPDNTQTIIQLAPLILALAGILFFKESYTKKQWIGFVLLIFGLGLFVEEKFLTVQSGAKNYLLGSLSVVVAALTWVIYALVQKQLLRKLSSQAIMGFIYAVCALVFFGFTDWSRIFALKGLSWGLLLFCAINTVGAYGAFAESLRYWPASRVSAVLAITPILSILFSFVAAAFWPESFPSPVIPHLAILGALLVITGSMMTALGSKPQKH